MERIKLILTLDIDPETGETTCVDREIVNDDIKKVTKKKSSSKKVTDTDTTPRIILEDNKYRINNAVVELLGLDLDEENRLGIRYEKQGKNTVPIFGTSTSLGSKQDCNKLTKSLTVACRGNGHDTLAVYGTEFTLQPHPTKEGVFILVGNNDVPDGDENVGVPDEITDDDLDLSDLVESNEEDNETEIDGFELNI